MRPVYFDNVVSESCVSSREKHEEKEHATPNTLPYSLFSL